MTLDEIRGLVRGAAHETHWRRLDGPGPTYLVRFGEPLEESRNPIVDFHENRAVLISDIDVGLAWGMYAGSQESSIEPWSEEHRPPEVFEHFVDVLYHGAPIERERYGGVDNGHGVIPWPAWAADGEQHVSVWQRDLAVVLRSLGAAVGSRSVDSYLDQYGIAVLD